MSAGRESPACNCNKKLRGPCSVFGRFDDKSGPGEDGRYERRDEIMKRVATRSLANCPAGELRKVAFSVAHEIGEAVTNFQLTQAATTPSGSHLTSFSLYIIKKFLGRRSDRNASSPCCMVHFSFSTVTKISPSDASIIVLPESRHAALAMTS